LIERQLSAAASGSGPEAAAGDEREPVVIQRRPGASRRMHTPLTAQQRVLRSRIAAHSMHSQHDSRLTSAPARAASPANVSYFERQVDPDGVLPDDERRRRAEHAKRAYFGRLALASARARSRAS
jgi:hypothetical protein